MLKIRIIFLFCIVNGIIIGLDISRACNRFGTHSARYLYVAGTKKWSII